MTEFAAARNARGKAVCRHLRGRRSNTTHRISPTATKLRVPAGVSSPAPAVSLLHKAQARHKGITAPRFLDLLLHDAAEARIAPIAAPTQALVDPLSECEQVLRLIAQGKTNREIAGELFIAAETVKAHPASIYRKLDVRNRTQTVTRARELKLV